MTAAPKAFADQDIIATGVRVIRDEIRGLEALASSLNGDFTAAVEAIHAMKTQPGRPGRLIIAGIGKSGHVARKIAATLASTGTPSFFVHPGEASHGDLGMISAADIVLLLSNSGETPEQSDLVHYTRRFGITLIGMTSNPGSTLAQHSDIVLVTPKMPEACPNGLAPTTSTTMMMALGDALAVALVEKMGLTAEQFKVFHPGGKLGQKLKAVRDIMHPLEKLPLIDIGAKMDAALIELTDKNLGAVIVVENGRDMRGIITDGDLKRHMSPDLLQKPVTGIMSASPRTIEATALAVEALNIMTKTPGRYLTSLIVVENGELAGMIRLQDCLQAGIA
ncbi:MAG: KpsF/GutQ family sugar-phosphate isomerase [Alphaproteobacteria bacterium]|nr:KpsF/GutQ family sugar-phosphate isomerase [Alphaproteobacteria bacterium]